MGVNSKNNNDVSQTVCCLDVEADHVIFMWHIFAQKYDEVIVLKVTTFIIFFGVCLELEQWMIFIREFSCTYDVVPTCRDKKSAILSR